MTLTQSAPLNAPAKDPNYTYKDADRAVGRFEHAEPLAYGDGRTQFGGQIDARQRILCDNAKAAGITIYTVQVNTGGDPTSAVLQYCASSPDKLLTVTSASQTATVFSSIGTRSPSCASRR